MGCKGSHHAPSAGTSPRTRGAVLSSPDVTTERVRLLGREQQGGPPALRPPGHEHQPLGLGGLSFFGSQGCKASDSVPEEVVQPEVPRPPPLGRRPTGGCRAAGGSRGCLVGLNGRPRRRWRSKLDDFHATQLTRYTSQGAYAQRAQTVIFLDWDDTLFPTTYLVEELGLKCDAPLHQVKTLDWATHEEAKHQVAACEARAAEVLRRANELGHVIVVTLATSGWVEKTCKNFFPTVGTLIKEMQIPVVYAKERGDLHPKVILTQEESERYWGLIKGRVISEKAYEVYSQYEGQTWKNILSIGDSSYERYGLLAATSAYMQGRQVESQDDVWSPCEEGCWEKVCDGHLRKLRAKCCKLVGEPDAEELAQQLQVLTALLEDMVQRDMGFDLNLDTLKNGPHADVLESIVRGSVPCWWALPLLLRLRW